MLPILLSVAYLDLVFDPIIPLQDPLRLEAAKIKEKCIEIVNPLLDMASLAIGHIAVNSLSAQPYVVAYVPTSRLSNSPQYGSLVWAVGQRSALKGQFVRRTATCGEVNGSSIKIT
jgi:hypothetical protein